MRCTGGISRFLLLLKVSSSGTNYYFSNSNKMYESLRKSVVAGALQTAGYLNNKKEYVQKINRLSKKIYIKVSNYNG